MERAESLGRMLDAHYRHSLLPHTPEAIEADWRATLGSLGMLERYTELHGSFAPATAFEFMAFDREHGSSIVSCLLEARENARAVRGSITSEMWETLNATWLEVRDQGSIPAGERDMGEFLEWVKYRSHLARGVMLGTMLRDEAFQFARLGQFIERGDGTARMLLARAQPLRNLRDDAATADANAWTILLRSLSAFEVYRKVYRDAVTPRRVTELLVLRGDLPRSLCRCTTEIYDNLCAVANDQSAETLRRAGELQAQLHFGRLDDLAPRGLKTFLESFLVRLRDIGDRVAQDFLVPVGGH
jgi:uncharacterized alpha-E superfamily protein